jgi:hypothetical protein
MLLHRLIAFCKASAGGAGSIWKYLEGLVRATGVSERFTYGFRTELHFADAILGINVNMEEVNTRKRSKYILIYKSQIVDCETFGDQSVLEWRRWHSGWRGHLVSRLLSVLVRQSVMVWG